MKFHHIGLACKDIKKAEESLGCIFPVLNSSSIVFDPEQDVKLCLVRLSSGLTLELIEGQGISSILKRGITYYHICFMVDDLGRAVKKLCSSGAMLVKAPRPAVLFDGRKVAFLQTQTGMVELLEGGNELSSIE